MAKLTIADRTAELLFDMTAWEEMEETVGLIDNFDDMMTGKERLKNARALVAILAGEGHRLGRGDEMPADWLKEHMIPRDVRRVGPAIRAAISEGMAMEHKEGEDQVTDVILAEIEKKEDQDA